MQKQEALMDPARGRVSVDGSLRNFPPPKPMAEGLQSLDSEPLCGLSRGLLFFQRPCTATPQSQAWKQATGSPGSSGWLTQRWLRETGHRVTGSQRKTKRNTSGSPEPLAAPLPVTLWPPTTPSRRPLLCAPRGRTTRRAELNQARGPRGFGNWQRLRRGGWERGGGNSGLGR